MVPPLPATRSSTPGTSDGIPTGVLAFEPRRSDLPLQVAFPILVSNLVGELVGASRAPTTAVVPGSLVSLPVPSGATGLRVTRPDGTTLDLAPAVTGGATATFASTEQLGVYTVAPVGLDGAGPAASGSPGPSPASSPAASAPASAAASPGGAASPTPLVVDPSAPAQFAVDLFDVGESTIAPGSAAALERLGSAAAGGGGGGAGSDRPPARDDLWIPLAAIALAFLVLEAFVFQRDALVRMRRWLAARLGRGAGAEPAGRLRTGSPARGGRADGRDGHRAAPPPADPADRRAGGGAPAAREARPRRRPSTDRAVARAALISALVMALAGVAVVLPADRLATVFVLDLSDSVGNAGRAEALAFVRGALEERPDGDVAGVVAFGKDALVERLPGELADLDRIASTPVRGATDVGAALRLRGGPLPRRHAAANRPALGRQRHDGHRPGRGRPRGRSRDPGGDPDHRPRAADEVLVDRIAVPTTSRLGEELEVAVDVRSTTAQPAAVRLYADGALVATDRTTLDEGITRVVFRVTPKDAGFHVFRAVVEAARDTFPQNDRADASTLVSGPPRVLVVPGDDAVAADLVAALKTREGDVVTMLPELVPDDPATLSGFDSIVLVDVPRVRFTDEAAGGPALGRRGTSARAS